MDNFKLIEQLVESDIDPNGAAGSILAEKHQNILFSFLRKAGRYTGQPYKAKKTGNIIPSGTFSWNGNSMNEDSEFILKLARKTADGNDISRVLTLLNEGAIIHFKDYVGRSCFLKFISFRNNKDANSNDICEVTVEGYSDSLNYTYQDNEIEHCIISFINKPSAGGGGGSGSVNSWNNINPDGSGNIIATSEDLPANTMGFENTDGQDQQEVNQDFDFAITFLSDETSNKLSLGGLTGFTAQDLKNLIDTKEIKSETVTKDADFTLTSASFNNQVIEVTAEITVLLPTVLFSSGGSFKCNFNVRSTGKVIFVRNDNADTIVNDQDVSIAPPTLIAGSRGLVMRNPSDNSILISGLFE
jgi:hypothetical protein